MVQRAIFTEPDDQTAWWYHQYLIALAQKEEEKEPGFIEQILENEIETIRGLLEESTAYRWAVLTVALLLQQLAQLKRQKGLPEVAECLKAEKIELYHSLIEMDPDHAERYQSILSF